MPRRRATPLLVLGAVVVAFVVAEVLSGSSGKQGRRLAPALPTQVLVGPRVSLASLRGRPVIVHFWASWCGPCLKEAPELAQLSSELHGRATLVGVDWSDSVASARTFVRKHHWTFPVLVDHDGSVGNRYDLAGLPSTFVLDRQGRIVKRLIGPQTAAGLLADLA
jgi:cytochrome c biogenesis protein CcmG/thiol:disulfide interchange protein DsbE